jgi:hypothetical protein
MSGLTQRKPKSKRTKSNTRVDNMLFSKSILSRQVDLTILHIGKNIMQTFASVIKTQYEGRCSVEGYIKNGSVNIISYSAGKQSGDNVSFTVVFDCEICTPTEGMFINCIASNITKAGIRAHAKETPSPVVIFIARDHYYDSDNFNSIREGDGIIVKVIGCRYEIYDTQISVIGEIAKK